MHVHEPRLFALLPAVGLCSCMVPSEASTATPAELETHATAPALIELPQRQPVAIVEAMIRSGRESLAAGHPAAALQSFREVAEQDPQTANRIQLDMIDAALGAGELRLAGRLISEAREDGSVDDAKLQRRVVLARELVNAYGLSSCEAQVDAGSRPLLRAEDALAAWNLLRSGLPADHSIPVPGDEVDIRNALCPDECSVGEPRLVRIDGDNEATLGLVVAHADGGFSVMPDVLHPVATGCEDETLFAVERHDGLVRVRAFGEQRELVEEWRLVEVPEHATTSSGYAPGYAYGGSGYQPHASSGYQAYGSSGYYAAYTYGCAGYDYDQGQFDDCQVHQHVERDVILDLDRGEVVLDVVRTGERGSALGFVRMTSAPTGPVVEVEACGVQQRLELSYT